MIYCWHEFCLHWRQWGRFATQSRGHRFFLNFFLWEAYRSFCKETKKTRPLIQIGIAVFVFECVSLCVCVCVRAYACVCVCVLNSLFQ